MIPRFGPEPPPDTVDRPGGYVLLIEDGRIALVQVGQAYALPGGGMDPGETPEQCAARETLEETGLLVEVGELLGRADQVVHAKAEATCFLKRGHYFGATIVERQGDGEADHVLRWLTPDEAMAVLHGAHRWAIETLA